MPAKRAFSMIEVIVGIGILASVLAPLIWFIGNTHRTTKLSLNEISASNFATEILEAVQALPVDCLAPIDGSSPNMFEGDLVQNGTLQESFYNVVFGNAIQNGFIVKIPSFPPGWNCNLIIKPLETESSLPVSMPDSTESRAKYASQMITITVRVTWIDAGIHRRLEIVTCRSRI